MIEGLIPSEIRAEGEAIRATLVAADAASRGAAAGLAEARTTRIHIIGNGTSYHSALAAAAWYRRQARAEEPTVIAMTAGEFRNYLPALGSGDAVIGISASGEFRDVVAAFEELRGRVPTVGVVHVPGSSLERLADYPVLSAGGPSLVPVMTMTYASTLTAALMVLADLLGGERSDDARVALRSAARDVEAAVAAAETRVSPIAETLVDAEHIFVVGSGNATAAAYEAALKLKEMALVHAEGAESWEMASGAATIIGLRTTVISLAPSGRGREATLETTDHARRWGARVIDVGPGDGGDSIDQLPLPPSATEDLAPLTSVAPVALLAFALARLRGHDPDHPGWVERYRSQGLRHIVGV